MRDILIEYGVADEIGFNPVVTPDFLRFYKENHFPEGEELYIKKDFASAYKYFSRQADTFADNIEVFANKAHSLFAMGKPEEAIPVYSKAIEISNSYHCFFHYVGSSLAHNIALTHSLMDNTGESQRFLEKADFLYKLNLYKKGDLSDTSQDLLPPNSSMNDLSIFSNSSLRPSWEGAKKLFDAKNFSDALALFCHAMEANEVEHLKYHVSSASVYYYRGLALKAISRYDMAKIDLLRALEFDKRNPVNSDISRELKLLAI